MDASRQAGAHVRPPSTVEPAPAGAPGRPGGDVLTQLGRFVTTGGMIAVLSVAVYWALAVPLHVAPMIANVTSYVVNVSLSFAVHRAWSFRGHGGATPVHHAAVRYFGVSLLALALNSVWTWLLTGVYRLPAWTPIVPMVFVTPLATFVANRQWVFRAPEPQR